MYLTHESRVMYLHLGPIRTTLRVQKPALVARVYISTIRQSVRPSECLSARQNKRDEISVTTDDIQTLWYGEDFGPKVLTARSQG